MRTVYVVWFMHYDSFDYIGVFKNRRAAEKAKKEYLDAKEPYTSKQFNRDFYDRHTDVFREKVRT